VLLTNKPWDNIGEGQLTLKGERNLKVYVISMNGKPLMPTNPAKARHLLRDGKANVVNREPFTIQLNYPCGTAIQPITLGVDSGSKVVGLSAVTDDEEIYVAEVQLRSDVTDNISTRRQLRRSRRNRKTRYRQSRFNNRKRDVGWLSPTINQKINTHMNVVADVHKILPITKIIVETASFDIQKIKNQEIKGKEYQLGEQFNFWNVREYVLFRDNHECQHCCGKSKDKILNVHHIESRKTGGNAPNNLITLCETCHRKYHNGDIILKVKRGDSFRDSAFMGIMRWTLYDKLKGQYSNVSMTYGYITKNTRIYHGLPKGHRIDALCITGYPMVKQSDVWYLRKATRRHNRKLHKTTILKGSYRKANQSTKYVFGFQLFDKVFCKGEIGFIFGRRNSGYFDIRKLNGDKLYKSVSYKNLKLIKKRETILTERKVNIASLSTPKEGAFAISCG
jgi:5-methylcytosine-specific restriction endonuclease McrA